MAEAQGYKLETPLGSGHFGRVYRARSLATGQLMAVKVIDLMPSERHRVAAALRECQLMSRIQHDCITRLVTFYSAQVQQRRQVLQSRCAGGAPPGAPACLPACLPAHSPSLPTCPALHELNCSAEMAEQANYLEPESCMQDSAGQMHASTGSGGAGVSGSNLDGANVDKGGGAGIIGSSLGGGSSGSSSGGRGSDFSLARCFSGMGSKDGLMLFQARRGLAATAGKTAAATCCLVSSAGWRPPPVPHATRAASFWPSQVQLVMQYCDMGTLQQAINQGVFKDAATGTPKLVGASLAALGRRKARVLECGWQ